jgi:aminomethyltransferase
MARNSPLHALHLSSGARFLALGDWFLVETYSTPAQEVQTILEGGGIYDASADSRVRISGEGHVAALDKLVTCSLAAAGTSTVVDGFVCNERGGVIDSLEIVQSERYCLLHGHFTTRLAMVEWWKNRLGNTEGVQVVDTSDTQGSVVLIGPAVDGLLERSIVDGSLPRRDHEFGIVQIGQARCLIVRRRFGGHSWWRLDTGTTFIESLWATLTAAGEPYGVLPVGWRAMEARRIESGIPRMGTEIDENTTPIEIGAIERVNFAKKIFPGRRALLHSTCGEFSRRLVHLEVEGRYPPAPGSPLETEGVRIGRVTSSVFSPLRNTCYALGFVDALRAVAGSELQARTLEHVLRATVLQTDYLAP